jgi:hypothetical protein
MGAVSTYYFHTFSSSMPSLSFTTFLSSTTSTTSRYEHATLSPYLLA